MPLPASVAVALTLALGNPSLPADGHRNQNVTVNTPEGRSPRTCADLEVTFDEQPAATAEDHITVPKPAGGLNLRAPANGGIYVVGSSRADFAVTVCKAVAPSGDSSAALAAIRPTSTGGTVSVTGRDNDRWIAYLLVEAPRDASIDLEALNGPLEVRDFAGSTAARTTNGPINLANVSGTVKVEVPRDFASGVRVESSNHSPWKCEGTACESAKRSWDDGSHWIELGRGPVAVRVATVNGPVAVDTAR